jgi:hypothetical protein
MHNVMLEMAGVASGLLAYAIGRSLLAWRAGHREIARAGRRDRLDGLLAPYDHLTVVPIPARDELPANVVRLRRRSG